MANVNNKTAKKTTNYIATNQSWQGIESAQWFLQLKSDGVPEVPPVTHNNQLDFLICGEEAFNKIYDDINNAKDTIDIICWGFDPGMMITGRNESGKWDVTKTYGYLLEKKAKDLFSKSPKIHVRILMFFSIIIDKAGTNAPGFSNSELVPAPAPGSNFPYKQPDTVNGPSMGEVMRGSATNAWLPIPTPLERVEVTRENYNQDWFERAKRNDIKGLELRTRNPGIADSMMGLIRKPTTHLKAAMLSYTLAASDHQKPILIDYDYNNGSDAVAYVMGFNSVTDYWDTDKHIVDDPKRDPLNGDVLTDELKHEIETLNKPEDAKEKIKKATKTGFAHVYQRLKPYRDYGCRIQGGALVSINKNFCDGWDNAELFHPNRGGGRGYIPDTIAAQRKNIPKALQSVPQQGQSSVQIVRTYNPKKESSIEPLYWQAIRKARNYAYIENQYFYSSVPTFSRQELVS